MLGEQHGEVLFTVEDNIIIAKAIGSFNEEGAYDYTNGFKDRIGQLGSQPFAILVDNLLMEGATPEAFKVLEAYNQWLNDKPLVAKAFVVKSRVTTSIVTAHSPSINQQTVENFSTKEDALQWLRTKLANSL